MSKNVPFLAVRGYHYSFEILIEPTHLINVTPNVSHTEGHQVQK